jgi:ferric-dicitrate binding protein FerR (iron transport regulator)
MVDGGSARRSATSGAKENAMSRPRRPRRRLTRTGIFAALLVPLAWAWLTVAAAIGDRLVATIFTGTVLVLLLSLRSPADSRSRREALR